MSEKKKDNRGRKEGELTLTEKVAIEWVILTQTEFDSAQKWCDAYTISHKVKDEIGLSTIQRLSEKWKASAKVKRYIQTVAEERTKRDAVIRKIVERDILQNDETMKAFIERMATDNDAYKEVAEKGGNRDLKAIISELNTLVDSIADPKEKSLILMKLGDFAGLNRDKVDKKTRSFYTPINMDGCRNCRLYQLGESVITEELMKVKGNV